MKNFPPYRCDLHKHSWTPMITEILFNRFRWRSLLRSTHKAIIQVRSLTKGGLGFPELRAGSYRRAMEVSSRRRSDSLHCQSLSSWCVFRVRPKWSIDEPNYAFIVHWGPSVPATQLLERPMALAVELHLRQFWDGRCWGQRGAEGSGKSREILSRLTWQLNWKHFRSTTTRTATCSWCLQRNAASRWS